MPDPQPSDERAYAASSPLVWGLALGQLVGWGTLYFAFALFVAPMEAELGWSRADLNGALTIGLLTAGLGSIPAGSWVDRNGGRGLMTAGSIAAGILLALWSQVETLPAFYFVWFGIGLATAATVQDLPFAVVTANVKDYRRAINYIALLSGLSSTVFLPLTNVLIETFGWRQALLVLAAIQFVLPTTLNYVLLRGTRGSRSEEKAPETSSEPSSSPLKAALLRPAFWGLALAFSAQTFLFTAITFHMIPLLQERGLPLDLIVVALALIGPSQAVGRFALFFFAARMSARTLGRIVTPLLPVSTLLLLVVAPYGLGGLALFTLVFGIGNGVLTIVRATGLAEILGTRGYGAIAGALNLVLMVPRTVAPLAVAALWEWRGSYDPVIWALVAITTVGTVAFWVTSMERSA
jgi:predicted MFS family arabinose efflux permease